jgi:hypothetical protein
LVPASDIDLGQRSRCSAAANYLETIANADFWAARVSYHFPLLFQSESVAHARKNG